MKKSKKIDVSTSFAMASHRLLRIVVEGIFEWNGHLFFCPFITLQGKKIFSVKTWTTEFKNGKYSAAFINAGTLILAADPVSPKTYKAARMHVMDRVLGIDQNSQVFQKGRLMIIKNGDKIDTLKFTRKLSDDERRALEPIEGRGLAIRWHFFIRTKNPNSIWSEEKLSAEWDSYLKEMRISHLVA